MVYFDTPRRIWFRGRYRLAVHCVADSVDELHAFAAGIGAPRRAFEDKPGRPHYDLFDELIDRARAAGATQVANRALVELLRARYGD